MIIFFSICVSCYFSMDVVVWMNDECLQNVYRHFMFLEVAAGKQPNKYKYHNYHFIKRMPKENFIKILNNLKSRNLMKHTCYWFRPINGLEASDFIDMLLSDNE